MMEAHDMVGLVVGHRYRVDAPLAGGPTSGRFRGTAIGGDFEGREVLITTAVRPEALDVVGSDSFQLANIVGVAPLLEAFVVNTMIPHLTAMAELEPDGGPIASAAVPFDEDRAFSIGGQLCDLAQRAADMGHVLGGIRPELVYCDDAARVTGVVPRAYNFNAAGAPVSYWIGPPFTTCYEPPELCWGEPVAGTDVYMIAATVQFLLTAAPPFAGRDWVCQRDATLEDEPQSVECAPGVAALMRAALSFQPNERPTLRELAAAWSG